MSTQYASYERIATVETYTYTATIVTASGKTTATLTARADLDCPRRRELKCPGNCRCWYTLYYNTNLQQYEPVHCNNCLISLYDLHFVPATIETPEPAAEVAAEPVATVEQVSAGIDHYKQVCAAWDAACEEQPVAAEVAQTVDAMIAVVDEQLTATEQAQEVVKTVTVEKLTAKHFLAWLRKQARQFGRRAIVGYIGDHIDTPLEMWLKEILHEDGIFSVGSVDGFEYNGLKYYLSTEFEGMSICVLEGDIDELPECGWREITAWEMLKKAEEYLLPEYKLIDPQYTAPVVAPEPAVVETAAPRASIETSETATQAEPEKFMILPYEKRSFIHMTAEVDEERYGLKAEQAYYLTRSESLSRCVEQPVYHVVVWSYEECRWLCPCGDPHRSCRHTRAINQDCKARKQSGTLPTTIVQDNVICASCRQPLWRGEDVHAKDKEVHITCSIETVEQQQAA